MWVLVLLTFVALFVGIYTDLKWREVPDWLNYGLLATAFFFRGVESFFSGWEVLLAGILGVAVCFVVAAFFYYSNQWGGGDAKLLLAMGAVIGLPLSMDALKLLWFFVILLFGGAIYGLLWMGGEAFRKRDKFGPMFGKVLKEQRLWHGVVWVGAFGLVIGDQWVPFIGLFAPMLVVPFYLFLFMSCVEKSCFYVWKDSSVLVEGDWLAKEINVGGVDIKRKTLNRNDLLLLQKKSRKVLIKEGIPFVPSFLIAYCGLFLDSNIFILLKNIFL